MTPVFLRVEDVLEIHCDQIDRYGGASGVRDLGLLESAIAQPSATFDGEFLHRDIFEMAAAYLYHVVMNHPFLDGNKRTGAAAALVFLYLNGIRVHLTEDRLVEVVLGVACGELQKPHLVQYLRSASEVSPEQS